MATKWTSYTSTVEPVTVTFSSDCSLQTGYVKFPKEQTLTISSTVGNVINVTVNYEATKYAPYGWDNNKGSLKASTGTLTPKASETTSTWTGSTASLVITNPNDGADTRITSIKVEYAVSYASVGVDDKNTGWYLNDATNALSNKYTLEKNKEYTFEFDINQGSEKNAWNNFVVIGSNGDFSGGNTQFIVRPDDYVFNHDGNGDGKIDGTVVNDAPADGAPNPTLSLMDGAMDWGVFNADLDGAHAKVKTSFDGKNVFVYGVITKGEHTYTFYYPHSYIAGDINIYIATDQTQLTNFKADVVDAYEIKAYPRKKGVDTKDTSVGSVKFLNTENVEILDGSVIGVGTKVTMVATPAAGYLFDSWSDTTKNPSRIFVQDAQSHTFYADFVTKSDYETEWILKNTVGQVYSHSKTAWTQDGNWWKSNLASEEDFTGVYKDDSSAETSELDGFKGILFGPNTAVKKVNDTGIRLYENVNATIKVPVKAQDVIVFKAYNGAGTRSLTFTNADKTTLSTTKDQSTIYVLYSQSDGFVEITNNSNATQFITSLKVTKLYDFIFADGDEVAATPGTSGYINQIAAAPGLPLLEGAVYTWSSSRPEDVQVDRYTGAVTVNNSFSQNVVITATREPYGVYPAVSKSYTLTATTDKLAHETNINLNLDDDGVAVYDVDAYWVDGAGNTIENTNPIYNNDIKYEVVSHPTNEAFPELDDEGFGTSKITIRGAGTVVVKAYSGAISCQYTITTRGFVFNTAAPVFDFSSSSYIQTIDGYSPTYTLVKTIGEIEVKDVAVNSTTGEITGLPGYDENKGGAVVVKATATVDEVEKSTYYTLTIPYKKYSWNFYREDLIDDVNKQVLKTIDGHSHLTMGDLAPANPHAASEITPGDGVTIPNTGSTYPEKYATDAIINATSYGSNAEAKKNYESQQSILKELTWKGFQDSDENNDQTNNKAHLYWDYTFKTREQKDAEGNKATTNPINYVNEPLFSYKKTVNGDNARIVEDTQGLIFNCGKNSFGINDSHWGYSETGNTHGDGSRSPRGAREMDRAILIYTGNSFTVPYVKKGDYVKLHWYRHSDNAGDVFRVSNACDLDDVEINPNHDLRFTGSHYEGSQSGYFGYTIVKAKEDGPITFSVTAKTSWAEIYTVELTDEYSTELRVIQASVKEDTDLTDGWGGPMCSETTGENLDEDVMHVVRNANSTSSYNQASLSTIDKGEKEKKTDVQCATQPSNQFGDNPLVYIASYPGKTYGWNGWTLDVECTPVAEDANKLSIGCQVPLMTRIGNNICYGVHAITNFKGTGTAHLIVRTKNGSVNGSPRYTLDKQEAYFPVGEYVVQNYPYTWDFTQYNINGTKTGSNGIQYKNIENSSEYSYGGWDNNKLATYKQVDATVEADRNSRKYNKFLFADGSQLTMNQDDNNGAVYIRETEGLRVDLVGNWNKANHWNNTASPLMDGKILNVKGDIIVPEVPQGMYVFVKAASEPEVTGATKVAGPNTEITLGGNKTETNAKVYAYQQNINPKSDVTIKTSAGVNIELIGVTDILKPISPKGTATESRERNIDHTYTGKFVSDDINAYLAVQYNADPSTMTLQEINVVPENTGVVLYRKPAAGDVSNVSDRSKTNPATVPFFVPACNTPNDDTNGNLLSPWVVAANLAMPEEGTTRYLFTDLYYHKDEVDEPHSQQSDDYAFYKMLKSGTLKANSCYLDLDTNGLADIAKSKIVYITFEMSDGTDPVETITSDGITELNDKLYYNINGVRVNGKPNVPGLYIMNGKKIVFK